MTTDLVKFEVQDGDVRLLIQAESNLYDLALAALLKHTAEMEKNLALKKQLSLAANRCKVNPLAARAGALAELVGRDLLAQSEELIIELGGNYFLKINRPYKIPVHLKNIALEFEPRPAPFSVCVSTGLEHSVYSFSKADVVAAVASDGALANAAAIAIGNIIKEASDIEQGLRTAKKIRGISGALIMKGDQLGILGKIKIVPL